jgi:hypothetical protein
MDRAVGKIQPKNERVSKSENLAWAKEVCNDEFFERLAQEIDLISNRSRVRSKSDLLGAENFKLKQKSGVLAFILPANNTIHLTPERLAKMRKKNAVDLLQATVIHEALHVTGHQKSEDFSSSQEVGFEGGNSGWGQFLNEGMTDILAFEIWKKMRQGYVDTMSDEKKRQKASQLIGYQHNVVFLIKLIFFLSKKSEVSEEVVFESFIDAYFSGGKYPEGNFKSELLNIFGKDLYIKLMKLDPKDKDFKSNLKELEDFLEKGVE